MNTKSIRIILVWVLASTLILSACADQRESELQATLNSIQSANAQKETQVVLELTQTAVEAILQTANAPTPTSPATNTPEPTATSEPTREPTATEAPSPTASPMPTPTSTPTATARPATAGAVCITEKLEPGLNGIRVGNNSGQDFSITLRCSGGPCMDKSNTYYKCKFPPELSCSMSGRGDTTSTGRFVAKRRVSSTP